MCQDDRHDDDMRQDSLVVFYVVALSVLYVLTAVFGVSSITGQFPFSKTASEISNKFTVELLPQKWTFHLCSITYIWMGAGIVFMTFRAFSCQKVNRIFEPTEIVSICACFWWCISLTLSIAWIFAWNAENVVGASVLLFLLHLTMSTVFALFAHRTYKNGIWLIINSRLDYYLHHFVLLNALAAYCTWTAIASYINFAMSLRYNNNYPITDQISRNIVWLLFTFVLILWFLVENSCLEKYVRYILTPYPVVLVFLYGIDDQVAPGLQEYVRSLINICFVLLFLRIMAIIVRHLKFPLYPQMCISTTTTLMSSGSSEDLFT